MAEDLNLRIRLTGDGSELKAELVGAKGAVTDLGAAATAAGAQLDAGLAKADAAAAELAAGMAEAKGAAAELGAAAAAAGAQIDSGLAKADAAAAELAADMAATAAAGRDLAAGAASVTNALDNAAAKAVATGSALTDAGADARALGTSVTAAAAQIDAGMASAAAAVTGLGAGLASTAAAASSVSQSWQQLAVTAGLVATQHDQLGASFRGLTAAVGLQAANVEILRARYVPLAAAEAAHKAALDEIARATKIGALSEAEAASAVARTTTAYQAATARLHTMGAGLGALGGQGKLTGQQMTQLSYQLNDVAVSLAGGINPLMVLLQQGSQITPLFGGVKGTLTALAGALTPTTVGFGLLAAGVGLGAMAFSGYITATKEVEVALAGLGRASGATVSAIQEIAEATADAAGLSVPAARSIELALVRTGKIGVEQFAGLIGITKDFAATLGTDVETASAKLAEILADPAKGAETLTRQLGLVDGATARYVERLTAQGRTTEAQNALMEAMDGHLVDASTATSRWARAWEDVSRWAANAAEAIGRALAIGSDAPSPEQTRAATLAALKDRRDLLRAGLEAERLRLAGETGGQAGSDAVPLDTRYAAAGMGDLTGTGTELDAAERLIAMMEEDQVRLDRLARDRASDIARRATGDAALTLADSLPNNSRAGRITALSDQEAKLRRGLDAPGLSAEENARIAASISAVVHARETLLAQTDPIAEAGAAELASIRAITPEQKRRAAEEKERLALVGEVITADEAQARITAAGAAAYEQATASIGQQNRALSVSAAASLSAAQAWLTSSEAGVAAEAARAAAVTQGLSAQAALDEEIAKAALSGAQQAAQLGDQASAQARLTDAVAAGTMTSAEAGQQMQVEQALRPLLIMAANAEGDEKKILTAVIERLRGAYAELNAEQERAAAVDATARQRQALGLAEYELSLTSETTEQREYLVALRQKEIELQERYGANWRSIGAEELRLYDQTLRTNAELKARTSQSDLVTGAWRRAGEQIQDSLSSSLRNALDGGSDAFENFADDTIDMMKDVAAEIASALVFKPIVGSITSTLFGGGVSQQLGLTSGSGIVPGGTTGGTSSVSAGDLSGIGNLFGGGNLFGSTGMLGGLNTYLFGSAGSSAATTGAASGFLTGGGAASSGATASPGLFGTAGSTSLGAVLGSAGAGFGISQIIAGFAPGNKLASAGGGALGGALIGAAVGGPVGAVVGGIAGLLGGLLNDKPSDKTGTGTVSDFSSTSSPEVGGLQGEKYSAENRAAATGAVDALRDAAQTAFGDYVDLSGISASISVGSRDGSRAFLRQDGQQVGEYRASSDEEGVKSIIGQSLVKIGKLYADKLPEEVRKALDVVDFSKDVDEALRLLDFAGSYRDTVTALTEGIGLENEARKAARTAIEDQIDALGKFREDAETIGLTGADEAIRAFALTMVGLKDSASDVSETEAALAALDEQFKVLAARASELGLTSAEVAAGYKKSLEAIRGAFEEDLNRAINSASGFGIYDQVQGLLDEQAQRQKDAAALGLDSAKIARLSALEIAAATRKATDAQLAGIAEIVTASESMAAQIGLTMGRILSQIDEQIAAAEQASTAARRSAEAWRAAADSVTEAIADLRGSDLSNLSPAQILAERRAALTETAAAAKAGDVDALAKLPELAKSFLDQSRAYNGDAQVYGRDFEWVQRLLDQAGTAGDHLGDKADRQADLLDRQAELLQDIADNLTAPEGPNAELLKRQQAELQRISG
ncbi:phage tail length tape measure family protein, partial [Zavarzinia aquatilis]